MVEHQLHRSAFPDDTRNLGEGLLGVGGMMNDAPRIDEVEAVIGIGKVFCIADFQLGRLLAKNPEALADVFDGFFRQVDSVRSSTSATPTSSIFSPKWRVNWAKANISGSTL
jgi:hypothetical protein